jgi:hypothetical protein
MGRVERLGNLPRDRYRFLLKEAARDSLGERVPFHQFEYERTGAAGFLEAVDGSDVRVIERSEDSRLSLEARQAIRVAGKRQWKNLDRDIASKPDIRGAVDFAHPANTEQGGNLIRTETGAWGKGQADSRVEEF